MHHRIAFTGSFVFCLTAGSALEVKPLFVIDSWAVTLPFFLLAFVILGAVAEVYGFTSAEVMMQVGILLALFYAFCLHLMVGIPASVWTPAQQRAFDILFEGRFQDLIVAAGAFIVAQYLAFLAYERLDVIPHLTCAARLYVVPLGAYCVTIVLIVLGLELTDPKILDHRALEAIYHAIVIAAVELLLFAPLGAAVAKHVRRTALTV